MRRMSFIAICCALLVAACSSTGDEDGVADLEAQIGRLEARISELEAALDEPPPPPAEPVTQPTMPITDPTAATLPPPPEGSRENPHPPGTEIPLGRWDFTITGFNPDATALVLAESELNDRPANGRVFVFVEVSATYQGEGPSTLRSDALFTALGDSGEAAGLDSDHPCGLVPQALDEFVEVAPRSTLSGNLCFSVPISDADSLLLVAYDFLSETRQFLATS